MKNNQSKLLLALTMCFSVAVAHAEGNNDKNSHSNKDNSGKSTNVQAADSCTAVVVATACGPVQKTVCSTSGSTTSTNVANAQKNKDTERHKDDGKDRGDGKDHTEQSHSDNSKYTGRVTGKDDADEGYDRPFGYHWKQADGQRKVTVCHREGGVRTTVDVDDDGHYHGHDNDAMDTEGRCEDQDDSTGKHTDSNNSGRHVVHIHKAAVCGVAHAYQEPDTNKHHKEATHSSNADFTSGTKHVAGQDDKDDKGNSIDTNKHRAGYRWVHDKDGSSSTTNDRQVKVVICHRMGNARVTLDVDDDGWFHGHSKHPMDTEGRCEDQDDTTHKHTDTANNGKPQVSLATEAACASTSSTATTTTSASCVNAGGVAAVLAGAGCGAAGTTCAPLGSGSRPTRGGVRNVR
jgi:hypothetical protein